ncbi:MAG: Gfo/Idh/MocA family oxidoreductase [Chitinophagales bacterium]|nr:Gfo/Idh/MocA family oxidoreductase [Chitinophagales bacterium]
MNLNIGIVGAGSFAQFAAKAFSKVSGISIVAVTDNNESAARQFNLSWNSKIYIDYEAFLNDSNIDLVYIATPPYLHYAQSKQALLAGKHVICEKPAALHASEAEELAILSKKLQLLYVVNLMQRYNPLFGIVKNIINENVLGEFLHGFFENYASDENLKADHWFWDESKSGGIFIEHGVHFFDLFAGWLGEGRILNAIQLGRPAAEKNIIDRVQATVLYKEGFVNFYHGFDQPKILDRQEMRLQFERGEITLYEWVPTKMTLHGLLLKEQLEKLSEVLKLSIIYHNNGRDDNKKIKGRFSEIIYDSHVTIKYNDVLNKEDRYQEMLSAMVEDQWKWIKDPSHKRVINESNAVASLKIAADAKRLAESFNSWE